jgi:hypothetical protein
MKKQGIYVIAIALLLAGCLPYPDETARTEDFDSVITLFDRSTDLKGFETYALSDKLIPITPDTNNIGIPYEILNPEGPVTEFVLSKVDENMTERGYARVQDPNDADLLINAGYIVLTTTVTQTWYCYDPWYWFWDPYWYGPGFPWGYPSYGYYYNYPCSFSYSYDVGTVLIQMLNGREISEDNLEEIWLGVFRGFASSYIELSRIDFGVDQAFAQTPFFN